MQLQINLLIHMTFKAIPQRHIFVVLFTAIYSIFVKVELCSGSSLVSFMVGAVGVRLRVWSILQFRIRGCSVELRDVSRAQWKVCCPGHMSNTGGVTAGV